MAKIVYLLGAGASFGLRNQQNIIEGLPIVSEIPQRLEYVIHELENLDEPHLDHDNVAIDHMHKALLQDLTWLKNESANHATIDTFAKKLWLTHKTEEYVKLKKLLAIYFIIEQVINIPDSRYDTFLANILTPELTIPSEISIITWNYDNQFEIAYKVYSDATYQLNMQNLKIFKLNGSATFEGMEFQMSEICGRETPHKLTQQLLKKLLKLYYIGKTNLSFAWENDTQFNNISQLAISVQDANTLVVIGYTFPFFNRAIDRKLMSYMRNLQTIYIQDPNAMQIRDNIIPVIPESLKTYKIESKINVQQFYLPAEL